MPIDEQRLRGLLERLEAQWVRQRAAVAEALQPGLTDGEIDALIAPLGIRLPDELRIWWRWHNGTEPLESVGPSGDFVTLQRAIEYYHIWRRRGTDPVDPTIPALAEAYWHQTSFPIVDFGGPNIVLHVETAGIAPGDPVPVRFLETTWDNYLKERAPSFTDAVQIWVDVLDQGYYWWSDDGYGGGWDDRYADVPKELRLLGPA